MRPSIKSLLVFSLIVPALVTLGRRPAEAGPQPGPEALVSTYYDTGSYQARLMLNNKGPRELQAEVRLIGERGVRSDPRWISVPANAAIEVDLAGITSGAGAGFSRGHLEILYPGQPLELGAQLVLANPGLGQHFYEQLVDPSRAFYSSSLAGLWWRPGPSGWVELVLSNRSDQPLEVDVQSNAGAASRQLRRTVRARQVKSIRLPTGGARQGGLSVRHSGAPGDLLARLYSWDPAHRLSSSFGLADPEARGSNSYHGAGMRLQAAGERLARPVLLVSNRSSEARRVQVRLSRDSSDTVQLPAVSLQPGEISDFGPAILERTLQEGGDLSPAGLELAYDGAPGDVAALALSWLPGQDAVQVPLVDPSRQASAAGGFPWISDESEHTVLFFKNTTSDRQLFRYQVSFPGGEYSPGLLELEAGATRTVDLADLQTRQVPDEFGATLPSGPVSGQVLWSSVWDFRSGGAPLQNPLIARAEYLDSRSGHSTTYACNNCCPDSYHDSSLQPGSVVGFIDGFETFGAFQRDRNCYGSVLSPFGVSPSSWLSTNTVVATVNSGGTAQCHSTGVADVEADWIGVEWEATPYNECEAYAVPAEPSSELQVIDVIVLDADVTIDLIRVDLNVGSGSNVSGSLKVELVGSTSHTVFMETVFDGEHELSFNITSLPDNREFTKVKATWTVQGVDFTGEKSYHIKVLSDYVHTRYNLPEEGGCTGSNVSVNLTGPDSCDFLADCTPYSTFQTVSEWLSEVQENGSGVRSNGDFVGLEWFCDDSEVPSPKVRGIDTEGCPACDNESLTANQTVAINAANPDLSCGDRVFVHMEGVRRVTDHGGGLSQTQLDHYSGTGPCNAPGSIGSRKTIKLF